MRRIACTLATGCLVGGLALANPAKDEAVAADPLAIGIEQLRSTLGSWNVVTEILDPDGTVTRSETGTYQFEWVVPDRVLRGETVVPGLAQHAAILFYVNESKGLIEMASVGADGRLWIMTGPIDGETRTTQVLPTRDGGTLQLRFTRLNVEADCFESRMEDTTDGGATWLPGNHQVFKRAR